MSGQTEKHLPEPSPELIALWEKEAEELALRRFPVYAGYSDVNYGRRVSHEGGYLAARRKSFEESQERISELGNLLREVGEKYGQLQFFQQGYANGSASISECIAAGDDFINVLDRITAVLTKEGE